MLASSGVMVEEEDLAIDLVHQAYGYDEVAPFLCESWMDAHQMARLELKRRAQSLAANANHREVTLQVLAGRGLAITPAQAGLVDRCRYKPQLDQWIRRALRASSADEVFCPEAEVPFKRFPWEDPLVCE